MLQFLNYITLKLSFSKNYDVPELFKVSYLVPAFTNTSIL